MKTIILVVVLVLVSSKVSAFEDTSKLIATFIEMRNNELILEGTRPRVFLNRSCRLIATLDREGKISVALFTKGVGKESIAEFQQKDNLHKYELPVVDTKLDNILIVRVNYSDTASGLRGDRILKIERQKKSLFKVTIDHKNSAGLSSVIECVIKH